MEDTNSGPLRPEVPQVLFGPRPKGCKQKLPNIGDGEDEQRGIHDNKNRNEQTSTAGVRPTSIRITPSLPTEGRILHQLPL